MATFASEFAHRRFVRGQAVCHDGVRNEALVLEQLSQQFQRCILVAALLDEDIEHLAFAIDGAPHEHPFAVDPHHYLVGMPRTVGPAAPAANVRRDCRTELVSLAAYSLVAGINPALGEHLLDIAQADGEAKI